MEIALLKEKIGSTKDSDDQTMIAETLDDNHHSKRPARLLPLSIIFGKHKNETHHHKINPRLYEQPTNCSDLSILGYTLNGFYQVKSNESSDKSNITSSDIKLETVYCAFKQPQGVFNSSLVEKRIISRRETTKPSSYKMVVHATRKTDLESNGGEMHVKFDKVLVNSGGAYDVMYGRFTVPISGLYLLTFRGVVTFPRENSKREFWISFTKKSVNIGKHMVQKKDKYANVELDKLFKGSRGEMIYIEAFFNEVGAKFHGNKIHSYQPFGL